jgi:hypothetical protein
LFNYKKQREALNSHVEALIQEKDNVLIDMELINLKSVSLLNREKNRRTLKVEIKKLVEKTT